MNLFVPQTRISVLFFFLVIFVFISYVESQDIDRIEIYPVTVNIQAEGVIRFVGVAWSAKGYPVQAKFQWSATGGIIRDDGTYIAGPIPGNFSITLLEPETKQKCTASVTIVKNIPPAPVERVHVIPQIMNLREGQTFRFSAVAVLNNGLSCSPPFSWRAEGGKVDDNGLFTAGREAGRFIIQAKTQGGIIGEGKITLYGSQSRLASINVIPDRIELATGESYDFQALGKDGKGETMPFTLRWESTGGEIDSKGHYTAGFKSGVYMVMASDVYTGVRGSATVFVVEKKGTTASTVARVEIKPTEVVLYPNQTVKFEATAFDSKGEIVRTILTWNVTGGTITPDGTFKAGDVTGKFEVKAQSANAVSQKALVNIISPPSSSEKK